MPSSLHPAASSRKRRLPWDQPRSAASDDDEPAADGQSACTRHDKAGADAPARMLTDVDTAAGGSTAAAAAAATSSSAQLVAQSDNANHDANGTSCEWSEIDRQLLKDKLAKMVLNGHCRKDFITACVCFCYVFIIFVDP